MMTTNKNIQFPTIAEKVQAALLDLKLYGGTAVRGCPSYTTSELWMHIAAVLDVLQVKYETKVLSRELFAIKVIGRRLAA